MMLLLQYFLSLSLLFSGIALALPLQQEEQGGASFVVNRIRNRDHTPHGPTALRRAYKKFNIRSTNFGLNVLDFKRSRTGQPRRSSNGTNGAVQATSVSYGLEYVSTVAIGGQNVRMNFDTGSADFWTFNTQLPASSTDGHSVYDPTKSKTSSPLPGFSWSIQYHDGTSASGNVVKDTVTIGGLSVANQAVELPVSLSEELISDHNVDGLVGIGFSNINRVQPQQQKTFFENVAPSLQEPVMTAFLNSSGVGLYQFGSIDSSKYTGDLISVPVDSSNGYWQFESPSFSVGGQPLQSIKTTTTSVADTGTSLLLVSPEVAEAYYNEVPGAIKSDGGYTYPCNTSLPTLALGVGDQYSVVLTAEALTYAEDGTAEDGTPLCSGGIQSCEDSQFQVFGDIFLKSVFTVFDLSGPTLQFGHLATTPTPPAFVNSNS